MYVHLFDLQQDLPVDKDLIQQLVPAVISLEGQSCSEVAVYFVERKEICVLHEEFFQDPTPTDCISFPMDAEGEEDRILGEVFVCPSVAKEYAETHNLDPKRELLLYVIHGLLHLLGYDDIEDKDREQMRAAERRHMDHLEDVGLIQREEA